MIRRNILDLVNDGLLEEECDEQEVDLRVRTVRVRINFVGMGDFHFKETFRLTCSQVDYVLNFIGHRLQKATDRSMPLSPKERLLLALHWLGNGAQMHGIGTAHNVVKSTVSIIVKEVVIAIVDEMFQIVVKWPENVCNIAQKFLEIGGFPCVVGCVDGTLINIDRPSVFEEAYVDRHGNHSLNAALVCGPKYTFYAANANWPGSCHDARVLRNTAVHQRFENGWRPFPGAVILGDSAYGLKEWLIPPLYRNPVDVSERRFNIAHKRTRRMIEYSIGIMKEKFHVLNHMRIEPEHAGRIVLACTALHNVACTVDRDDGLIEQQLTEQMTDEEVDNAPEEINPAAENNDGVPAGALNRLNALLHHFQL